MYSYKCWNPFATQSFTMGSTFSIPMTQAEHSRLLVIWFLLCYKFLSFYPQLKWHNEQVLTFYLSEWSFSNHRLDLVSIHPLFSYADDVVIVFIVEPIIQHKAFLLPQRRLWGSFLSGTLLCSCLLPMIVHLFTVKQTRIHVNKQEILGLQKNKAPC